MAGILDFLLDPKAVPFYFDPNNDMNEANDTLAKIEEKHVRTLEKLPDYLPKWLHHNTFPPAIYEGSNTSTSFPDYRRVMIFKLGFEKQIKMFLFSF